MENSARFKVAMVVIFVFSHNYFTTLGHFSQGYKHSEGCEDREGGRNKYLCVIRARNVGILLQIHY